MKLLFLGDFFYDYDYISEDIDELSQWIKANDYKTIVNLETVLSDKGTAIKKRGPNLRSSLVMLEALQKLNCVAVCLANNHAMDYGAEGLLTTIELLNSKGIQCVGAGQNYKEATGPLILAEEKCVIVNYGWDVEETVYASNTTAGCAPLNRKEIVEYTAQLRAKYPQYKVIHVFHWGFEYNTLPMPLDVLFAHRCVDAGSDLIIGHHPHVIQPCEEYGKKNIFYSLGNFYFGSRGQDFRQGYINECCENYGDYGIGVVFDTDTEQCREKFFFYDRSVKKYKLQDEYDQGLLTPFSMFEDEDLYAKQVVEHAYKPNPILGSDEERNTRLLRNLERKYRVAARLQFLKQSKLGRNIYGCLKRLGSK